MLYTFTSACIFTSLISFFFTMLVLYKNPKAKTNITWSLMGFSVAVWALGLGLMASATEVQTATFYLRYIHYLGALMIPTFFLHFVLELLGITKQKKIPLSVTYAATALLQAANLSGHLAYVKPISPFNFYTQPYPIYYGFTLLFFLVVIYTNYLLFKQYKISTHQKKNQIGYMFLSMVIGFIGGSTAFFPVFGIPIFPFGMYFSFLHIPIMAYAIIKHQLMEIDVFLKRSLVILFLIAVCALPLFIFSYLVVNWEASISLKSLLLTVLVLGISLVIPKLKIRGEFKIENILFGKKFDHRKALLELQNAFVSKLELEELLKTVVTTLSKALDLREAAIFLRQPNDSYKIAFSTGSKCKNYSLFQIPQHSSIIFYFSNHKITNDPEELTHFLEKREAYNETAFFHDIQTKLVLSFYTNSGLIGFLVLGAMNTDFKFSYHDKDLFNNLSTEIAIAIENAMAFKQIRDLNDDLKQKITELKSAQEQIVRSAKLAGVGTLAAGIAHEINNALNATINSAHNLMKFWKQFKEQKTTEELSPKIETSIQIIHQGMERSRNIIDHLMRFSRKSQSGFKMDHVQKGIESTLQLLGNELKMKSISVQKIFCDSDEVFCNLSELNQVFLNIILNATDAVSKNGHISIQTYTKDNHFFISIKDDGPGIEPKNLEQIFDPFFTTKPVGKGTGLGLSTSYSIVRDHGGQIDVKSVLGEGTEFIISLPINIKKIKEGETYEA